ncbi:MAG: hypothetical protein A2571_01445 [Candidatus Vogelbacteria bacterium RIFOXYD1_FULL_44_32]|uniref:Glycosyltransferase RgtA/B/C/D-like domain-containing protein n=1 Tax=Candidatus Vogelbacteria bacterium RIFOXYD1_FULL_44_32 TaxID=1802438 RepID=A0A1G2QCY8_9BACT|nr:MAG: hypothetical protein A2571_01445 [Candidatus Vogelbacteria bacterium RIFOXYD1_FULL_44_32]
MRVKISNFFNLFFSSPWFFGLGLVGLILLYVVSNVGNNISSVSSDVWLYNFSHTQTIEGLWSEVPKNYTNEPYYLAYPILNWAAANWQVGVARFHFLALFLLTATYLVNGLVIFAFTKKWWAATLAGLLLIIPHNVFSTQIGMLNFNNVRGLGFAFPFYFLLSFYWIHFGLGHRVRNIVLAITAGALVYLYPLVGVIIVPLFVLTAAILKGKKYWREISLFFAIYLLVSSLFWYGHFTAGYTGMLNQESILSPAQANLQIEILKERFHGSLFDLEFGKLKRSAWDGLPLLVLFIGSIWWIRRRSLEITPPLKNFTSISLVFSLLMVSFTVGVEIINQILSFYGQPAFFIEHIRLLRALGFVLIGQVVVGLVVLVNAGRWGQVTAFVLALLLLFSPLSLSTPVVRPVVRTVVPTSIRTKYNLAPIVDQSDYKSFSNLEAAAIWSRDQLAPKAKIFVFDDSQWEFIFKILSKHDTNLTVKEGSVWTTAGFANSLRWYTERQNYKQKVESAGTFGEIVLFARSLEMTHMLIPRGKYEDLFKQNNFNLNTVYVNPDYRLIKL